MFDPDNSSKRRTVETTYYRHPDGWWTEILVADEPKNLRDGEILVGAPAVGHTPNSLEHCFYRRAYLGMDVGDWYIQRIIWGGIEWWSENRVPICPMADRMSYRLDPNKKHYPTLPPIQAVGV